MNRSYINILRKIPLIIFITLNVIYHGLQIEYNKNMGWEVVRIIEIILIFLLLVDCLYLQIFEIKLVKIDFVS